MNFLLNHPFLARGLINLGLVAVGFLLGAPFWLWLRGVLSKKIMPGLISHRRKTRKQAKADKAYIESLVSSIRACQSIYREADRNVEAKMRETEGRI